MTYDPHGVCEQCGGESKRTKICCCCETSQRTANVYEAEIKRLNDGLIAERAEIERLKAAFASLTATCMEMTEAYDASRERLRAQLAALRKAAECARDTLRRVHGSSIDADALDAALANTEAPATCEHCGKPWKFTPLCGDCEQLVCQGCGRVKCSCACEAPAARETSACSCTCHTTYSYGTCEECCDGGPKRGAARETFDDGADP
jgi:hypothetical protein